MMDTRAAKLALARKKLKDHQDKKSVLFPKDENTEEQSQDVAQEPRVLSEDAVISVQEFKKDIYPEYKQDLIQTNHFKDGNDIQNVQPADAGVNVTEILISNKRKLEIQISELQSKLSQIENDKILALNNNNICRQQINHLENELRVINDKHLIATQEILSKNKTIEELNSTKSSLTDENNNLQETLEFTKTILTAKESENASLHSQLCNLQNQLDVTQLKLQQLINEPHAVPQNSDNADTEKKTEVMLQKISSLEQQLKTLQKERDQISVHYENYVSELNGHLSSVVTKNESLTKEIQNLSIRENNLIDQISDMEIRLQNYQMNPVSGDDIVTDSKEINELKQNYANVLARLQEMSNSYIELQSKYSESEAKVKELSQAQKQESENDSISMSKLNADITSDKVAAQRATEQNKKLKTDLHELEEAFVKFSRDKLEFTEKLTAEKYLNRELTIKLAEIDEKAKDMHTKLMAKDEEMIRLLTNYREIEKKYEELKQAAENSSQEKLEVPQEFPEISVGCINSHKHNSEGEHECLLENGDEENTQSTKIPKLDAMLKLQERFLKIMGEVADLSDEKHRLEHIILQLQNETDTICEYVALYQQQRSLLQKRDEERSAQIKIFQSQCDLLKNQVEELSDILKRFAEDKELAAYFQVESRYADLSKVMQLLDNLKNNSLIDQNKKSFELKDFHPCSCCSGQLIDL